MSVDVAIESTRSAVVRIVLDTPPPPCFVPEGVFDAFGWCLSEGVTWISRGFACSASESFEPKNPSGMLFLLRRACEWLPTERAFLHVGCMDFGHQMALAPYGIDAATDQLFERRVAANTLLELVALHANGLFWGLHDWVHFHNHGSFERVAWTELQCDLTALWWLHLNHARCVSLDLRAWGPAVIEHALSRFVTEDPEALEPARRIAWSCWGRWAA